MSAGDHLKLLAACWTITDNVDVTVVVFNFPTISLAKAQSFEAFLGFDDIWDERHREFGVTAVTTHLVVAVKEFDVVAATWADSDQLTKVRA
jgi:hypothetical protein